MKMKVREAVFEYRCQRCQEVFEEGRTREENGRACLVATYAGINMKVDFQPKMHTVHYCKGDVNHGIGLGILIGYRIRES